jgi:hypothetical protein
MTIDQPCGNYQVRVKATCLEASSRDLFNTYASGQGAKGDVCYEPVAM